MNEFDDFDDVVNDLMRMAGRLLNGERGAGFMRQEPPREEMGQDEVIDGRDRVTYVLQAPGREEEDFKVNVARDEVDVTAPDLEVRRQLPSPVDPKTAVTSYRNGVLSVSVRKA